MSRTEATEKGHRSCPLICSGDKQAHIPKLSMEKGGGGGCPHQHNQSLLPHQQHIKQVHHPILSETRHFFISLHKAGGGKSNAAKARCSTLLPASSAPHPPSSSSLMATTLPYIEAGYNYPALTLMPHEHSAHHRQGGESLGSTAEVGQSSHGS